MLMPHPGVVPWDVQYWRSPALLSPFAQCESATGSHGHLGLPVGVLGAVYPCDYLWVRDSLTWGDRSQAGRLTGYTGKLESLIAAGFLRFFGQRGPLHSELLPFITQSVEFVLSLHHKLCIRRARMRTGRSSTFSRLPSAIHSPTSIQKQG